MMLARVWPVGRVFPFEKNGLGKLTAVMIAAIIAVMIFSPVLSRGALVHPLVEVFTVSGAVPEQTDIQVWSRLNRRFLSLGELRDIVERVAARLHLSIEGRETAGSEDNGFTQYQILWREGQATLLLMGQSVAGQGKTGGETYVVLRLVSPGLLENMADREAWLREGLRGEGETPEVYLCLSGYFPSLLSSTEGKRRLEVMLQSVQAQEIDHYEAKNLVVVSAYSTRLREQIRLGKHIMNLNLALRFDPEQGVTRLWVGSPLITEDY